MNELRAAGMTSAELIEGKGNPLVYAEWLNAPGKPTILFYGHYDVQPPDPLDEWKSPPFEPEIRGNDIFARGACDDKGQVYIQIKAVEGLLKTTGKLPVNVKFLLEGEEEPARTHRGVCQDQAAAPEGRCGGGVRHRNVRARVSHYLRGAARPGVLRTAGGRRQPRSAFRRLRWSGTQPDAGHRGDYLRAEGPEWPHPDPRFYDRVVPPSPKERAAWARLPFNEKEYTEVEMGARELVGEPEVPLFERVWARPTVEVHGIRGGFTGEGAKTVIPARAVAKISTRLVGDQLVEESIEQTKAAVKAACPKGVTAELKVLSAGAPSLTNPDNPFIHASAEAMKQIFGKETVYIRSAGRFRSWAFSTATWASPAS